MNECLNSDDDDKEAHGSLFSSFEYLHRKSSADTCIQGDEWQPVLKTQYPFLLLQVNDIKRRIPPPLLENSKNNGLIT